MLERWPEECGSVGYQGRSIGEFCEVLSDHGVEVLIDVRARAWSHRPEFRKTALREALQNGGIRYIHLKCAGNPFRPRKGEMRDRESCAVLFRQHLSEHPEIINRLDEAAQNRRVVLFCYEADTADCHRGVLLDALSEEYDGFASVDL